MKTADLIKNRKASSTSGENNWINCYNSMDYLILNELSYPFADKYSANQTITTFIKTFSAASSMGFNQLRLHQDTGSNLFSLELAPGFRMSQLDDDKKYRLKEILTSAPLITDSEPIEKETYERSSFEITDKKGETRSAAGLGAAFLLDTIAMSFLSSPFWDTHEVKGLNHFYILDNGSDTTEVVSVRHAGCPAHIERHSKWFQTKKEESLKSSRELWERREEFFPNLTLCGNIKKQLTTNFGIRSKYFNQVVERLKQLDAFAKKWISGQFSDKQLKEFGLNVSGESRQTLQRYGRERRFRLPDGSKRLFEKHIKTGDLRFHFYPDEQNYHIYVGYIGAHLSTVTN
jgi:hypothetical protein